MSWRSKLRKKEQHISLVSRICKIFGCAKKKLGLDRLKYADPFYYIERYLLPRINPNNNEFINWAVFLVFAFLLAWVAYFLLGVLLRTSSPLVIVLSYSMVPEFSRGDVIVLQGISSADELDLPAVEVPLDSLKGLPLDSYAYVYCYNTREQKLERCEESIRKFIFGLIAADEYYAKYIYFFHSDVNVPIEKQGPVVVYNSDLKPKQIIHRALVKIRAKDGWYVITKGDSPNNRLPDQMLTDKCITALTVRNSPDQKLCVFQQHAITRSAVPVRELQGKAVFYIPLIGYVKLIIFEDIPYILRGGRCPVGQECYFP
jgi:signal peptidase I